MTKLKRIEWVSDREDVARAESLRKMFLAMADDVRVVLIKLADRLHNMRTIGAMPKRNQLATAQETMEIYAPLANRLGIWQIKSELEDLAFRALEPDRYRAIDAALDAQGGDRTAYINRIIETLKQSLGAAGIQAEVYGRAKHLWSIARKMDQKRRTLDEIYDAIAIRVIVPEVKDCYAALGIIHTMWRPIPGEFDDYIASPKESMYQSLHTAVRALDARPVEVQIRTKEMHIAAEYGIASHWRYKEGKRDAGLEARVAWLRQLMDWRDEVVDAQAFVETLKSDVFQEMLYVFTPAGDIIELPAGSTPVDFAYRIHSDVGHTCVGAMVNDRLVPLDYQAAERRDDQDHDLPREGRAEPGLADGLVGLRPHGAGAREDPPVVPPPAARPEHRAGPGHAGERTEAARRRDETGGTCQAVHALQPAR